MKYLCYILLKFVKYLLNFVNVHPCHAKCMKIGHFLSGTSMIIYKFFSKASFHFNKISFFSDHKLVFTLWRKSL